MEQDTVEGNLSSFTVPNSTQKKNIIIIKKTHIHRSTQNLKCYEFLTQNNWQIFVILIFNGFCQNSNFRRLIGTHKKLL